MDGNHHLEMTVLMTPDMANFSGNVHGGTLLKLLDQVSYACACRYAGSYVVTLSVDQVLFRQPIHVGELVTFLAASSLLVPAMGSLGACLGIVIASGLFAIFGTWQIRRHVPYSLRTWALVSLLGIGLAPIVLVWDAAPAIRFALFSAVFVGSLMLMRVLGPNEIRALQRAARR